MKAGSKMEKYIYSKSWYGRRIVVKQLAYKDIGPYFAGYIELKKNDPKDWLRHAGVGDQDYFYGVDPFTSFPGCPTFAGYLLDDEHHIYVGFDTQEFAAAYNRDDCIEILKEVAKKLASHNK